MESLTIDMTPPHSPTFCELLSPICVSFFSQIDNPQESVWMQSLFQELRNCYNNRLTRRVLRG